MALAEVCPDPERLHAWLSGALPDDERVTMVAHLDACVSCREVLDRLVSAAEVLGGLTPGKGDIGAHRGPALRAALASLKGEAQGGPRANRSTEQAPAGETTAVESPRSTRPAPRPREDGETVPVERAGCPDRIGPYKVIERVGRGGMGEVFRALDPALERVVAVKILALALADNPEARRRFLREARAAAAVCHDHVVTIHAVDDSGDLPYLIMQFVAGRSLQEKIDREAPLGLKEILRIGMQIASGLAAAHAQGLVHRDIKPANILLENGVERVKITDFGLARAASDPGLTRSGTIMGTPNYMSPEQARGEAVGPRSDLFSLGSVLYAMATGEPPFAADSTVAVLRRVCDDAPRPIRELNPEFPDWLAATIGRLMSKQSEARFETAEEVAELLRGRLAELQGPTPPRPEPASSPALPAPRRARWFTLALTSLVVLAAVIAGLAYFRPDWNGRRDEGESAARQPHVGVGRASSAVELGVAASRGGDHRAAVGHFTEALRLGPESVAALIGRGRGYSALEDWPRALADLDTAIRLLSPGSRRLRGRGAFARPADRRPCRRDRRLRLRPAARPQLDKRLRQPRRGPQWIGRMGPRPH